MPDKELTEKPDFPVGDSGTLEAMRSVTVMVDRGSITGTYEKLELRLNLKMPPNLSTRDDYDAFTRAAENLLETHRDQFVRQQMDKSAKDSRSIQFAKPAPVQMKPTTPANNLPVPTASPGWTPWKSGKPGESLKQDLDSSFYDFLMKNGYDNKNPFVGDDGYKYWFMPPGEGYTLGIINRTRAK